MNINLTSKCRKSLILKYFIIEKKLILMLLFFNYFEIEEKIDFEVLQN